MLEVIAATLFVSLWMFLFVAWVHTNAHYDKHSKLYVPLFIPQGPAVTEKRLNFPEGYVSRRLWRNTVESM